MLASDAARIRDQRRQFTENDVGCVPHHPTPRGVDDVATRESVVDPLGRLPTDSRLHNVDECGNVMVRDRLTFFDGSDEGVVNSQCRIPTRPSDRLGDDSDP